MVIVAGCVWGANQIDPKRSVVLHFPHERIREGAGDINGHDRYIQIAKELGL